MTLASLVTSVHPAQHELLKTGPIWSSPHTKTLLRVKPLNQAPQFLSRWSCGPPYRALYQSSAPNAQSPVMDATLQRSRNFQQHPFDMLVYVDPLVNCTTHPSHIHPSRGPRATRCQRKFPGLSHACFRIQLVGYHIG